MNKLPAKISLPVLALFVAGCISGHSPTVHFYQLQSDRSAMPMRTNEVTSEVVVGPIVVSPYLKRPQMARRSGTNEVLYDEVNRWAEPLESNISQVLTENLSELLGTDRIFQFPLTSPGPSGVAVTVKISRFEGTPGAKAFLWAHWSLRFADTEGAPPETHSASLEETVAGNSISDVVEAQGKLLAAFSRMIAEDVSPYLDGHKKSAGDAGPSLGP